MRVQAFIFSLLLCAVGLTAQNPFIDLNFILGSWQGTGKGFGNNTSTIDFRFQPIMDGRYIEVVNHSTFEPTETNQMGEQHQDWGIISYDKNRQQIIYRQFNSEGYVNQYTLVDSLTNDSTLVFVTEQVENFTEGGKARYTIKRISENELETLFDVSFPGREFTCFGTYQLKRKAE